MVPDQLEEDLLAHGLCRCIGGGDTWTRQDHPQISLF